MGGQVVRVVSQTNLKRVKRETLLVGFIYNDTDPTTIIPQESNINQSLGKRKKKLMSTDAASVIQNMEELSMNRQIPTTFTPSPNHIYDRSMLRIEINHIFNQILQKQKRYAHLKNYSFVLPLQGAARENYGDHACYTILELCEEIRKNDPHLLHRKTPKDISMEIFQPANKKLWKKYRMINQQSLKVHDDGILTFRLDGSWIAKRISMMLTDGIYSWAPVIYSRKTKAAVVTTGTPGMKTDMLRASYISDAIASMLLFSGLDVREDVLEFGNGYNDSSGEAPPNNYLESIRHGVCTHKADLMVYMIPHLDRDCIQESFTAARKEEWFRVDREATQLACIGYQTLGSDQIVNLATLWHTFLDRFYLSSLRSIAEAAGYTADASFGCCLKYTWLRSHRLAEYTSDIIGDFFDEEGNTFAYLLRTKALVSSLIKNSGYLFKPNEALAGKGERELGLHLVEFTRAIEKACKSLVPDILCGYVFNLSKLFTSYYREVWPGKVIPGLCKATEAIMAECFHLLGIAPDPSWGHLACAFLSNVERPVRRATAYDIIPSPSEARCSRFEMFTMRVNHSEFKGGDIFGYVSVMDAYVARPDGWTYSDAKDCCYVDYFNAEWPNSLAIATGSSIPFGDPSGRRSVPLSSSIELHVQLHAVSKRKEKCYLIFHNIHVASFAEFWSTEEKTMCGTIKCEGVDSCVLMNYILLRDGVDTSMELTFDSSNLSVPINVCGLILAYYGEDVVNDHILGEYKAVIFKTNNLKLVGKQVPLALHKSALAVPANGCLKIDAFFMEVESKRVIVRETKEYRAKRGDAENWHIDGGNYTFNFEMTWS